MTNKGGRKDLSEPQTLYDKSIKWFKNNKIFTTILILSIIYTGVSEVIKKTIENKEYLFGTNGLLKKSDTILSIKIPDYDTVEKQKVHTLASESPQADKIPKKRVIRRLIKPDTITLTLRDTIYLQDTSKPKSSDYKYSYRSDDLKEGKAFVDPLTSSTISIFTIQPDFTASAILDYPDGFNTIYFEKPGPIKVRPGDSWTNIYYHEKNYKMTVININYSDKTFSIEIQEND